MLASIFKIKKSHHGYYWLLHSKLKAEGDDLFLYVRMSQLKPIFTISCNMIFRSISSGLKLICFTKIQSSQIERPCLCVTYLIRTEQCRDPHYQKLLCRAAPTSGLGD